MQGGQQQQHANRHNDAIEKNTVRIT